MATGIRIKHCSVKLKKSKIPGLFFVGVISLSITAGLNINRLPDASASITTDRSAAHNLENKIAQDGTLIQTLVTKLNQAHAQDTLLTQHEHSLEKALLQDQKNQSAMKRQLRQVAIEAYVSTNSQNNSILSIPATGTAAASVYSGIAGGTLSTAIAKFQIDQARTRTAGIELSKTQKALNTTIANLQQSKMAADEAIATDDSLLTQVKGNINAILAAEAQRNLARQQQAELEMAHRAAAVAAANQASAQAPARQVIQVTAQNLGTYANPLRSIAALSSDRIDQGVDYTGYGPIYAVGDGVVLSTYNGGWPGGTFICYRLTDGPASGLVVYAAEDINPTVQVGQSVNANTVIGDVYEGPDGIETGWAAPAADGLTMASANGQFYGSNSTAFGANFSQLLQSLGAPGGALQNPPTGAVPPGWPSF